MFNIEKGIPLPKSRKPHTGWPFDQMEVGDSFFADNKKSAATAACLAGKSLKRKFVTKAEGDGLRVWRAE